MRTTSVPNATDDFSESAALSSGVTAEEGAVAIEDSSQDSLDVDMEGGKGQQTNDMTITLETEKKKTKLPSSSEAGASQAPGCASAAETGCNPGNNTTNSVMNVTTSTNSGKEIPCKPPSSRGTSFSSEKFGHCQADRVKSPLAPSPCTKRLTTVASRMVGSAAVALEGGAMECQHEFEQHSVLEAEGEGDMEVGIVSSSSQSQLFSSQRRSLHDNDARDARNGNERVSSFATAASPSADIAEVTPSDPPAPQSDEEHLPPSSHVDDDPGSSQYDHGDDTHPTMEHAPSFYAANNNSSPQEESQDLPHAVPVAEPALVNQGNPYDSMDGSNAMSAVVQAHPIDDWTEIKENKKCCSKGNGAGWSSATQWAVVALLLVVLIVVGAVVGITQAQVGDKSSDGSAEVGTVVEVPISDEVNATTTAPVDMTNVASFPTYPPFSSKLHFLTLQAMDDPTSAQSRANSWMTQDPNLANYDEQRLLQRFALATLYYSTRGDNWERNDLWLDYEQDECHWYNQVDTEMEGAICNQNSQIVRLKLSRNGLKGVLPVELFFFPALASLDLSHNGIYGTAPTMFAGAGNLQRLVLSSNQLTGQFTAELGFVASELAILHNDDNLFTGAVPGLLRLLPNLHDLNITGNQYTGSLPSSLLQLSNTLTILEVADNSITGVIPSELGMTTHLKLLDVGRNARLHGTIPSQLSALVNLTSLIIDDTKVSGSLPLTLCELQREGQLHVQADCAGLFNCCSE